MMLGGKFCGCESVMRIGFAPDSMIETILVLETAEYPINKWVSPVVMLEVSKLVMLENECIRNTIKVRNLLFIKINDFESKM